MLVTLLTQSTSDRPASVASTEQLGKQRKSHLHYCLKLAAGLQT